MNKPSKPGKPTPRTSPLQELDAIAIAIVSGGEGNANPPPPPPPPLPLGSFSKGVAKVGL